MFFFVIIFSVLIWLYEKKNLKNAPRVDKITFYSILAISMILSMFYLEKVPGPLSLVDKIFSPISSQIMVE